MFDDKTFTLFASLIYFDKKNTDGVRMAAVVDSRWLPVSERLMSFKGYSFNDKRNSSDGYKIHYSRQTVTQSKIWNFNQFFDFILINALL